MVTITTSNLPVPTSTGTADSGTANNIRAADNALNLLLNNTEVIQALTDQTAKLVPPSKGLVMSLLWSLFSTGSGSFLGKDGVSRAVIAGGGSTINVDALWGQINTQKQSVVSAADFAVNGYLNEAVVANLDSIREAVEKNRLDNAMNANSTNLLEFTVGGGGNVLDLVSGGTGTVLDLFS